MDPWEQIVSETQITPRVQALNDKLVTYDVDALSVEDRAHIDRVKAVTEQIDIVLENTPAELINLSAATSIASSLSNISSYLDNWTSTRNSTYLNSHVFNETNSIIQSISALSPTINLPEARAAITRIRRSAGQQKRIVEEITQEIKTKGSLADTTIDEKISEAKEAINDDVAVVSKKLEDITTESEELSEQLETVKSAANKLATEQTTAFNTAQTERSKEFTDLMALKQGELDTTLDRLAKNADEKSDAINRAAEKDAQATLDAKNRAEKLLGIVSQDALISDYSKNAKREWWSSLVWQIVAALSILLAIICAAFLAHEATGEMVWQKLVARLTVVAAFGGLATYAAKQATEHRQAQRQSEHMALQLSAVRPYLEDVTDKTQRDTLLIKLADKFFSEKKVDAPKKKPAKDKGEEFISANDLLNFIATIIKRS
jgi:hypothetical protein